MSDNKGRTIQARPRPATLYIESAQPGVIRQNLDSTQHDLEDRQLPCETVGYKAGQKTSLSQRGKRKLSSMDGDHDQILDRQDSKSLSSALSRRRDQKRSKIQPRSEEYPPRSSTENPSDIRWGLVKDGTNHMYQPLIRCCAEDRHVSGGCRTFSPCNHTNDYLHPPEVVVGGGVSSYSGEPWTHVHQQQVTAAVDLAARAFAPVPAPPLPSQSGWPHSLPELHWPFDGFLYDHETKRGGGGGGGSQPSTTGSQGFPQFVTAGPDMSLIGNSLFGYDRSELIGCISWA